MLPISLHLRHRGAVRARRAAPVLVLVAGQVASGKSTLARALTTRLGAVCIEGDRVRDDLLGVAREAVHEARWERVLGPAFEERLYAELLRRAQEALASGLSAVIDACFPRNTRRLDARSRARRHGAAFLLVECRTRDETLRARLAERDAVSDQPGWQKIHDDLAARWEAVSGLSPDEHLRVAGDGHVQDAASVVLAAPCLHQEVARARRPSAVTFDCWNTLLYEADWETAHALRVTELQAAAREAGRDVSRQEAQVAFDAGWERHTRLWREGETTGAREVALWSLAE
jgi:predicted kinase